MTMPQGRGRGAFLRVSDPPLPSLIGVSPPICSFLIITQQSATGG